MSFVARSFLLVCAWTVLTGGPLREAAAQSTDTTCTHRQASQLIATEVLGAPQNVYFLHLAGSRDSLQTNDITPGETIGTIAPRPDSVYDGYRKAVERSNRLYEQQDYRAASNVLDEYYVEGVRNPFVLHHYARAMYRTARPQSVPPYRLLVDTLDAYAQAVMPNRALQNGSVPIDAWFFEAYWKLGTLYMDLGEWERAIYEMGRGALFRTDLPKLQVQMMSYQAKAFHKLGRTTAATCIGSAVLQHDPDNTYVRPFME